MNDSREDGQPNVVPPAPVAHERVVYLVPEHLTEPSSGNHLSLQDFWRILWWGKWLIISVTAASALTSVLYALAQMEWYRAEVVLAPADDRSAMPMNIQLSGLAALAGVNVGGGNVPEALAVLRSRQFARSFIQDRDLLAIFFQDQWDPVAGKWREEDLALRPDMRDAVEYFHKQILRVNEDRRTSFVTLGIEWTDSRMAAEWANELVFRLNKILRHRALEQAESNIVYLQKELEQTNVVALQQSVGRLLESELQKLMLARGNEQFAFRIIDPADVPKRRVRPNRTLIALVGTLLGGVVSLLLVIALYAWRTPGTDER